MPTTPRLFVNIASYRDTECQWTLQDLFHRARHPERIVAGICWQFVRGVDDDCFVIRPFPERCRIIEVEAQRSQGCSWARSLVQDLWQGEEFTLQIDSHMRFVRDWDEKTLDMWAGCKDERAVLTGYPPPYVPPDRLGPDMVPTMFAYGFDCHGILTFQSRCVWPRDAPQQPQLVPFCSGNFLFAPSRIIEEVPADPRIFFIGEEMTLGPRLWTAGWNLYAPNAVLAYHDYTTRPRPRPWHDNERWYRLHDRACHRVRHILDMQSSEDPNVLEGIERYGLGSERSLASYEAFSGVDFRNRTISGAPP